MYSRTYGKEAPIPPDYSGIAIKHHPPEIPKSPPPRETIPAEKNGGQILNMLSGLSAEDLLIYGVVIYMSLSESDSDLLLVILLVLVLI